MLPEQLFVSDEVHQDVNKKVLGGFIHEFKSYGKDRGTKRYILQ